MPTSQKSFLTKDDLEVLYGPSRRPEQVKDGMLQLTAKMRALNLEDHLPVSHFIKPQNPIGIPSPFELFLPKNRRFNTYNKDLLAPLPTFISMSLVNEMKFFSKHPNQIPTPADLISMSSDADSHVRQHGAPESPPPNVTKQTVSPPPPIRFMLFR